MNRIFEILKNRIVYPGFFVCLMLRVFKTQVIQTNKIIAYNRSLRK